MTDSDAGRAACSRKSFGKHIRFLWIQDAVAKKKVTLKRKPSISNVADLGTKHFTKERFEALRKMVDMEAISDRNSVRYIGTITCDKNEALELAQADFSLKEVSTRAMAFGSRWMCKPPCRRRHTLHVPINQPTTSINISQLLIFASKALPLGTGSHFFLHSVPPKCLERPSPTHPRNTRVPDNSNPKIHKDAELPPTQHFSFILPFLHLPSGTFPTLHQLTCCVLGRCVSSTHSPSSSCGLSLPNHPRKRMRSHCKEKAASRTKTDRTSGGCTQCRCQMDISKRRSQTNSAKNCNGKNLRNSPNLQGGTTPTATGSKIRTNRTSMRTSRWTEARWRPPSSRVLASRTLHAVRFSELSNVDMWCACKRFQHWADEAHT